jgi:flagellin-like hook-associated protein FlgL
MLKKIIILSLVFGIATQLNAFETQTNDTVYLAVPNTAQNINVQPFQAPVDAEYVITTNTHAVNGGVRPAVVTIVTIKNGQIINEYSSPALPRGAHATLTNTFNTELAKDDIISFRAKSTQNGVNLPIFNTQPSFKATIAPKETKTKLF